jgi:hypothetical protein
MKQNHTVAKHVLQFEYVIHLQYMCAGHPATCMEPKSHQSRLACLSVRIWPLGMPPKLTWRLQPLDTHGSHPFKIAVHQMYQRSRACTRRGEVFLLSSYEAIRFVFEGRELHRAFEHNGCGLRQALIAHKTKAELQLKRAIIIEPCRPSSAELARCFPKNALKAVEFTDELLSVNQTQLR